MEQAALPAEAVPPPRHVAVIMDGNGRWAKARGLPRVAGHRRGAEAVRATVTACRELGIRYLTLYAFSSENWKRPAEEVGDLMGLLRLYLTREIDELNRAGVRVRFIGDRARLSGEIVSLIDRAETTTRNNQNLDLVLAVSYGGHDEIVRATRAIAREVAAGRMRPEDVTEERFTAFLDTADIPPPDLIIRTSGEQRLSNFLLWQAAYSEFVFLGTLWPDFGRRSLEEAIEEFRRRERRYGASGG
ncbi:MAG: isoprenyl transferase [Alphaproteobacteria bacterium]|nr:isoprenyl transferase [Alphaproteobacteria bacterium]